MRKQRNVLEDRKDEDIDGKDPQWEKIKNIILEILWDLVAIYTIFVSFLFNLQKFFYLPVSYGAISREIFKFKVI